MSGKFRYTQIEFPPYRFIPGENPHPTENPLGHSYGKKKLELTAFAPEQWRKNEHYLYGVDLYNDGYWWESHEAFEELWRITARDSLSRDFLQGLIKISGALIKWQLKNRHGLEYLYKGAMMHLFKAREASAHFMGVNMAEYIGLLQNHFSGVINDSQLWPDPLAHYPYIILEMEDK